MENTMKTLVSIVIPAKNETQTLPALLNDIRGTTFLISEYDFETIVVDDHSTDETSKVATAHGAQVVANLRPGGKGNALISGFEKAKGSILVMMDADYSHRPEHLPLFLKELEKGHGLVVGSRQLGGSDEYTPVRTLGNIGLSAIFRLLTGVSTSDVLNGYKAFRQEVFKDFTYRSAQFEIEIELMINTLRKGWTIGEFASHERERAGGEAKSRVIRHGTRFLIAILKLSALYQFERLFKHSRKKQ